MEDDLKKRYKKRGLPKKNKMEDDFNNILKVE